MNKDFDTIKIKLTTLANNGTSENFFNACMWISIKNFLDSKDGTNISIAELRKLANFNEHHFSDFNLLDKKHANALESLCKLFKINVNVYFFADFEYNETIGDLIYTSDIGNIPKARTANIALVGANPGNHFELIEKLNIIKITKNGAENIDAINETFNISQNKRNIEFVGKNQKLDNDIIVKQQLEKKINQVGGLVNILDNNEELLKSYREKLLEKHKIQTQQLEFCKKKVENLSRNDVNSKNVLEIHNNQIAMLVKKKTDIERVIDLLTNKINENYSRN